MNKKDIEECLNKRFHVKKLLFPTFRINKTSYGVSTYTFSNIKLLSKYFSNTKLNYCYLYNIDIMTVKNGYLNDNFCIRMALFQFNKRTSLKNLKNKSKPKQKIFI